MTPAQIAYREYLKSDHWRALRLEAFQTYGRKCFKCPATCRLDIHHLVYRHPWTSGTVQDVRPCCRRCHELEHGIVRVVPVVQQAQIQKLSRRRMKKLARQNRRRLKYLRRKKRMMGQQKKATIYYYTKPYTKRSKWVNRGNSSN